VKVVILCGGKGTRSYPFTEYFPKAMMPIGGQPIIVHLMKLYAAQGFNEFILAAGHRQEVLRDYFAGRSSEWDINILDTGAESDTGERIRRCAPYVGSRFFATYCDGLGDVNLHQSLRFHAESGGEATVTTVRLRSQYGQVVFDAGNRVSQFREKPMIHDCWINAGFFVFDRSVFDNWHGQNLETEVLPHLARQGRLFNYCHDGFWKSMDTSKDQAELERICSQEGAPWKWVASSRGVEGLGATA
jgi:glucose-1-phosphate cytidylyltransferase